MSEILESPLQGMITGLLSSAIPSVGSSVPANAYTTSTGVPYTTSTGVIYTTSS